MKNKKKNLMFNPLEQFLIYPVFILFQYIVIDNIFFYYFLILILFYIYFILSSLNIYIVPKYWQLFLEDLYIFLINLAKQQLNNLNSFKFFPLIISIFLFILFSNIIGLLPLSFTLTSHIFFTFLFAFSFFFGITIYAFYINKFTFFRFFLPSNVPMFLIPFLIIIELLSYFIRPFSLAIRLFANMLAGHTLLFILSSFVIKIGSSLFFMFIFFPFIFVFLIVILEISIAFIQAYVFCILLFIYLNDIYKLIN